MSLESDIFDVISALCGDRCYPDLAPLGATLPFVVYQQVGGQAINPIKGVAPGTRHARVQVNVWASTRVAANALMNAIEDALRPSPLQGRPEGAFIARYDDRTELRGAQQDFSFWRTE